MSSGGGASGTSFNSMVVILLLAAAVILALMAVTGPTIGEIAKQINAVLQSYQYEPAAQISADYQAHATSKHGGEAMTARQCAERPEFKFYNPTTQRFGYACWTDAGKIGLFVFDEEGREITAFLKNKMKSWDQFFNYMKNAGYQQIQ